MGQVALFIASFLAATVIPFSSTPVLVALILKGESPVLCTMVAGVGNTLGGMTCYGLGYWAKWDWIEKYAKIKKSQVIKTQMHIEKWKSLIAMLTWLPLVGDPLAIGLGLFRVHWFSTMGFMMLGKTIRYGVVAYLIVQGNDFYRNL